MALFWLTEVYHVLARRSDTGFNSIIGDLCAGSLKGEMAENENPHPVEVRINLTSRRVS
jgi:hypothetical protein